MLEKVYLVSVLVLVPALFSISCLALPDLALLYFALLVIPDPEYVSLHLPLLSASLCFLSSRSSSTLHLPSSLDPSSVPPSSLAAGWDPLKPAVAVQGSLDFSDLLRGSLIALAYVYHARCTPTTGVRFATAHPSSLGYSVWYLASAWPWLFYTTLHYITLSSSSPSTPDLHCPYPAGPDIGP